MANTPKLKKLFSNNILILLFLISVNKNAVGQHELDSLFQQGVEFFDISHKFLRTDNDSCIYYTALAYNCFREGQYINKSLDCLSGISNIHGLSGNDRLRKQFLDSAFVIASSIDTLSLEIANVYLNLSSYYYDTNQLLKAEDYLRKTESIEKKINITDSDKSFTANNLATVYGKLFNYKSALSEFSNSIKLQEKDLSISYFTLKTHLNKADLHIKLKQFDMARVHILEATSLLPTLDNSTRLIDKKLINILEAKLLFHDEQYSECLTKLNFDLNNSKLIEGFKKDYFKYKILSYLKLENDKEVQKNLKEANAYYLLNPRKNVLGYLNVNGSAALYFTKKKNLVESERILKEIKGNIKMWTLNINKSVSPLINLINIEHSYWQLYCGWELYQQEKSGLSSLITLSKTIFSQFKEIRKITHSSDTKEYWANRVNNISSVISKVFLEAKADPSEILLLMEMNRSNDLMESEINRINYKKVNLPDSLIIEEESFNSHIAYLQNKLSFEIDSSKSKNISNEIQETESKKNELLFHLKKQYPSYFENKENEVPVNIITIQQRLRQEETLISYFSIDTQLVTLVIDQETSNYFAQTLSNKDVLYLNDYKKLISDPNSNRETLTQVSKYLFNLLIPANRIKSSDRLIIIPHGIIEGIIFEALVDTQDKYLIKNYPISYQASVSSWNRLISNSDNEVYGAHTYSYDRKWREAYNSLKCSMEEVQSLSDHLQIPTLKISDVNYLKQNNFENSIIHIASHAQSSSDWNHPSNILINDAFISDKEIQNSNIAAELFVLSGCNSGIGTNIAGEGDFTLNKALLYSRCKSTIVSKWKIDDCSSSKIIDAFYENLIDNPIDIALQKAKLHFIEEAHPKLRHPYYWAPLYQTGRYSELEFEKSTNNKLYLFGLMISLVVLTVGFYFKKSTARSNQR